MAGEVLSKQRLEEIREDVYQVHEWSGIDIRHSDVRLLIETIDHYVLRAEAAEREAEECRKLESECENMAMMIRRMSWQLAKYKPDATVLKQAKGYLEKIGRQGNILRDET